MQIFKLQYGSREEAILDLLGKEIITEDLKFTFPVHAVVEINPTHFDVMLDPPILQPAEFDENGEEISPAAYKVYDFGENEIKPLSPDHNFAGWVEPDTSENITFTE